MRFEGEGVRHPDRGERGGLAEASYIVIHEIPGGSWGYDGKTRAARAAQRTGA